MSASRSVNGAVLVVAGPTASGKSALAVDVAESFGGVVINGDSLQVYCELSILSAAPTAAERARVPHRLFGVLSAAEGCSAGHWLALARQEITTAWAAGHLPVVVGGTGMYLKALMGGLVELPLISPAIRKEARALHARLGGEAFRTELARLDPEAAARLPAGDVQRLTRAYEVAKGTGRTLADWQRQDARGPGIAARFAVVLLLPPREVLYAACDARFRWMVEAGALEEVKALLALDLSPGLTAMKAVGVRELARHLAGDWTREEAIEAAQRATRNYVKRQITWLRHQVSLENALVVSEQYSESLQPEIFSFIRRFLLTAPD
jgi:tRNA dimethylallyltransferase